MSYFRAENLSLHFGGLKAVDAVSFAVEKGEILSIIGPNGAGKSSIFNLISRIYSPTSGKIFFEDQDITQEPAYGIARLGIARSSWPRVVSLRSACSEMKSDSRKSVSRSTCWAPRSASACWLR